jgi:hypothetical protein
MAKATKPTAPAKTSRPVTLKHLAATLAGEHHKIAPLALVIAVRGPSARLPALCKPSN